MKYLEMKNLIYGGMLTGYLMMNGMRIIRMEKNQGRPWRNVFIFEDTDEVMKLIEIYKNEKSKETSYEKSSLN